LNPLDRYLFLYFLTNNKTNICGVYEIPLSMVSSETGITKEMLIKMMHRLRGKIDYIDGWIVIRNFQKYQNLKNPKIVKGIEMCISEIPYKIREKMDKNEKEDKLSITNDKLSITNEQSNLIKSNTSAANAAKSNSTIKGDPRIKEILDFFHSECVREFGIKPEISGRDAAMVKTHLKAYSVEQIKDLVVWYLKQDGAEDFCTLSASLSAHWINQWKMKKNNGVFK